MINELLYGKDNTERVVSIEIKDDKAILFIEDSKGNISTITRPNKNWLLSNNKINESWLTLEGNLHYKYAKILKTNREFQQLKKAYPDLFYINNAKERFMCKEGVTYFKNMRHTEPSILSFDIETTTLDLNDKAKILLIANTFRKNGQLTRKMFCYDEYESQGEMLQAWCEWVRDIDPSIITGYNINLFDLPYINFIAQKEEVKLLLGRDKSKLSFESWESKFRKDGSQFYHYNKCKIYGREIIDGLFLAIKYDVGRKYESYRLKHIIAVEGLEKPGRTFYDADQIRHKYQIPEEWTKIKAYASDDGDDGLAIYDLMSPPLFYSSQIIPKPYQLITESAEGSKINSIMIRSYLQEKHSLPKESEKVPYEGAISIGNPGIYKNVFKIDVSSLYPSIMIQYEVYEPNKDPKGHFLTIVKSLTEQRLNNKRLAKETNDPYYSGLEQSQKILINSAYGFLAAAGLLFNASEKAAFITATGREILQMALKWSENKGFKLVNADTDSISFSKGDEGPFSEKDRSELLLEINKLFPEKIKWEDDGLFSHFIVVKAKNYIMKTIKDEVKYKGSAIKATTKEPALQQFIKDIIESIFNDKRNYNEIYLKYVKEALAVKDIKRWASKKTVTQNVLNGTRKNETKVVDAIADSEYAEGDKIYTYFKEDDTLGLAEKFDGKYNKEKLLEKLFKTSNVFETIIPEGTFINYKLKKSKVLLESLK